MESKQTDIKIGSRVSWISTSAGTTVEKIGNVVDVVPADDDVSDYINIYKYQETHSVQIREGSPVRNHDSFLVEVPATSERSKPRLYFPVTARLKLVTDALSASGGRFNKKITKLTRDQIREILDEEPGDYISKYPEFETKHQFIAAARAIVKDMKSGGSCCTQSRLYDACKSILQGCCGLHFGSYRIVLERLWRNRWVESVNV